MLVHGPDSAGRAVLFVLIAVELIADRVRGQRNYRLADAINSLSTGVLSTSTGLLTKGVGLVSYALAWEYLAFSRLPGTPGGPGCWLSCCTTCATTGCTAWDMSAIFFGPPIRCITRARNTTSPPPCARPAAASSSLDLLPAPGADRRATAGVRYRGLAESALPVLGAHAAHPKLGWLEWVLITPSNHRVHHAQNPLYLDRNYAGVFILWDRLFGTFRKRTLVNRWCSA